MYAIRSYYARIGQHIGILVVPLALLHGQGRRGKQVTCVVRVGIGMLVGEGLPGAERFDFQNVGGRNAYFSEAGGLQEDKARGAAHQSSGNQAAGLKGQTVDRCGIFGLKRFDPIQCQGNFSQQVVAENQLLVEGIQSLTDILISTLHFNTAQMGLAADEMRGFGSITTRHCHQKTQRARNGT